MPRRLPECMFGSPLFQLVGYVYRRVDTDPTETDVRSAAASPNGVYETERPERYLLLFVHIFPFVIRKM